ncbi:RNA-directed DNA polymerase, eukaryota, reverse transcriptase zinc-binding domain protein [Tanacetum coccineum]
MVKQDDLLVLCIGDVESVGVIKKTMEQFSSSSDLFPNMGKSKEFLWVKWVNVVKLKGTSIWDIEANYSDSYGILRVLYLKSFLEEFGMVKDYEETKLFSEYGIENDDIESEIWKQLVNDKVYWLDNQNERKEFSTKQAWANLRENAPKVDWYHVVWFSQFQPMHVFLLWLAIKERLATQDRLAKWNCYTNSECPLCKKERDSHAYLFFKCEFAKLIWRKLTEKIESISNQDDLKSIVNHLSHTHAKSSIWKVVNRLVLAVMRLVSFKVKQKSVVLKVADTWNLRWDNMSLKAEVRLMHAIEWIVLVHWILSGLSIENGGKGLNEGIMIRKCSYVGYSPSFSVNGSYNSHDDAPLKFAKGYCGCRLNDLVHLGKGNLPEMGNVESSKIIQ